MRAQSVSLNTQSGAVLFIALIMLLVLTVIGVTAMQTTTLEEKMAGNLRDQTLAFQAAEAALREGETCLANQAAEPVAQANPLPPPCATCATCAAAVFGLNTPGVDVLSSALWDNTAAPILYRTYAGALQRAATAPRYLIEYHSVVSTDSLNKGQQGDGIGRRVTFRTTARGTGGSDAARAHTQSTYSKRFDVP